MKFIQTIKSTLVLLIVIVLFDSCVSTTQESVTIETIAVAEGPFFEGPNSLMAEYKVDLEQLLKSGDYSLNDFEMVNIESVLVSLVEEDSLSMSDFSSASLSIVSGNEPLTGIAILNPIESTSNELKLQSSEEADLAPFFKEGSFTLVLDWGFNADDYRDQMSSRIKLNLNLELLSK